MKLNKEVSLRKYNQDKKVYAQLSKLSKEELIERYMHRMNKAYDIILILGIYLVLLIGGWAISLILQ